MITALWMTGSQIVSAHSSRQTRYYWYDNDGSGPNAAAWHTTAPAGGLNLSCESDEDRICSANFTSAPSSTNNLVSSNPGATSVNAGNYE